MRLDVVAVTEPEGLHLTTPPRSDLVALAVPALPPLPELSVWTARINRPVIIGLTGADAGAEGLVLDRWGHVAARHAPALGGDSLVVHKLGGRLLGLLLGPDRFIPEKARALALMGVDLVVGFGSEPRPYGPLWAYAQQNQFLALEVSATPAVYGACEMTTDGSGIVPVPVREGWGAVSLPWAAREQDLGRDPVLQALNPEAYLSHPWWGT